MRKAAICFGAVILMFALTSCIVPVSVPPASILTPSGGMEATPTPAVSPPPEATPSPTPSSTPTPVPSPTPETPDAAGSGEVMFDIYQKMALRDLNLDGTDELIAFTAGEAASQLLINGTPYEIPHAGLAQLFAITDVSTKDKMLELVFTEKYNPALAEGKYAFSYLFWWNGTEALPMGGLMDVKFDGAWRSGFDPAIHFDGNGTVMCLTDTDELTYLLYMGHYEPSGSKRVLDEDGYSTAPVGEVKKIKCKKPCLLLDEITRDYFNSAYDYYWIPTLYPYTAGRVPHVEAGIEIIAQPGEWLSITKVYGKTWFKLKTSDGYQGWINCKNHQLPVYYFTMGWTASDMFSGL